MSCTMDGSKSDLLLIHRIIREWSHGKTLGMGFGTSRDWIAESESGWAHRSRRLSRSEAIFHATIDSLSDAPSTKQMKDLLHSFVRSKYHLEQLDIALARTASRLNPSFLENPTADGDSLITLARTLLQEADSTCVQMAQQVRAINERARSMALADTIASEAFQFSREHIIRTYFEAPTFRAHFLGTK
jgi:hypothetical protein